MFCLICRAVACNCSAIYQMEQATTIHVAGYHAIGTRLEVWPYLADNFTEEATVFVGLLNLCAGEYGSQRGFNGVLCPQPPVYPYALFNSPPFYLYRVRIVPCLSGPLRRLRRGLKSIRRLQTSSRPAGQCFSAATHSRRESFKFNL